MYKYLILTGLLLSQSYAFAKSHSQRVLEEQLPFINYISLPVQLTPDVTINTSGQLRIPRDVDTPVPAVLILHNSAGVDSTGAFYAKRFNKVGYATLELDLWGGRGLTGGSADRPGSPHETLADAYAALTFLAEHSSIDQDKIAIMGFSWGGVMSMLTATNQFDAIFNSSPYEFSAHIAHYPVCYVYNQLEGFEFSDLTGSPMLIQSAEFDDYDYPGACPSMVSQIPANDQALVEVVEYPNVSHTWDRLEPELIVEDPFGNVGQGGEVLLAPDFKTAQKSRRKAVQFLKDTFEE